MPRLSSSPSRDLALIATFAALIAALGLTPPILIGANPVPITLQTLGVMLAGCILGARRAAAAVTTFLVLVAAGLPLLSGGRGGLAPFLGPRGGYLIGWIFGAYVIGLIVQLGLSRPKLFLVWAAIANVVGGMFVVYLFGVPVQAARIGTKTVWETAAAAAIYLPGDLLKVAVASIVSAAVFKGYPVLQPQQPREREAVGTRD